MVIHLSDMAFTGMVLAALEAFRKECFGLLLGQQTREGLVVQYAVPYQTADRHASWVRRDEPAHRRMEKFLNNLNHVDLIGDFHSHTQGRGHRALCRLSTPDRQGLGHDEVCLILALNQRSKYQPWKQNRDGSLSGTVEDYFLKIGAWHRGTNGDPEAKVQLLCPFAVGLTWK
jgi:hypothetical protein